LVGGLNATIRLLGLLFAMLTTVSASELNMIFTNSGSVYNETNTWIKIQRGQPPSSDPMDAANVPGVSYGGTQLTWNYYTNYTTNVPSPGVTNIVTNIGNVFADPVLLKDIKTAGGLQWVSNAPSAVIWVSYGSPLSVSNYSLSAPSISNPSDANYNIPYTTLELTYYGNNSNDQGDITAINSFTGPVRITAFTATNGSGPTVGKTVGFNPTAGTTAAMLAEFQQITGGGGKYDPDKFQRRDHPGNRTNSVRGRPAQRSGLRWLHKPLGLFRLVDQHDNGFQQLERV